MTRAAILGIDLGTTNACCAVVNEQGEPRMVPLAGGDFTIPSVYAVDAKGQELLGLEAKRQGLLNPQQTVAGSKRLLGLPFEAPLVDRVRPHVTYPLIRGERGDVAVEVRKKPVRLVEVAAKILAKLKDAAAEQLGNPVEQAVIAVPAYYNDMQRQAVREAGGLAGLQVLRLINEPTAAALAFGASRRLSEMLVVYDLGGGTFDVSVVAVRERTFEVKGAAGDMFLGGIDFDNLIIDHVAQGFRQQTGLDLHPDPVAMQRLRDAAERAKVDLSSQQSVDLTIPFVCMTPQGQPVDLAMPLTRATLEALAAPLIERSLQTCREALQTAGLTPAEVAEVLLVGGQTRMPLVARSIEQFFGKPPSKRVHPDEAVAQGAALFAWSLDERSDLKLQMLDVLPMAIGIESAGGKLHRLFTRNAPVPNRRLLSFTTHRDQQREVVMRLYQGDHEMARDNTLLGEFTFTGLRPDAAGKVRVEVVFDVNVEGILSLQAKDPDTGQTLQQSVRL